MPVSIEEFLLCPTPDAWLDAAVRNVELLLVDHATNELKASSNALSLMFRYAERTDMLQALSKLVREENRHFEFCLEIMERRGIVYRQLAPSRYAGGLRRHVRSGEPDRLIDLLIVSAIIEARSCERFRKLAPRLDEELGKFYRSLFASEERHFLNYLRLAERYAETPIGGRVQLFLEAEAELIRSADDMFRFHSGVPAAQAV